MILVRLRTNWRACYFCEGNARVSSCRDKSADFTANPLKSDAFSFTTIGSGANRHDDKMPARVAFDIELATDTTCRASGQIIGIGDKSMGWSQYAIKHLSTHGTIQFHAL